MSRHSTLRFSQGINDPVFSIYDLYKTPDEFPDAEVRKSSSFMAFAKRFFLFFVLSVMVLEQSAWATCGSTPGTIACSTVAGNYGIPAADTVGTASYNYDSCSNTYTYLGGCSAPTPVTCTSNSNVCTDSTPCKFFNGNQVCLGSVSPLPIGALQIPQTCWSSNAIYTCNAIPTGPTCTSPIPSTCSQSGSNCLQTDPQTGLCLLYDNSYNCSVATNNPALSNTCGGALGSISSHNCINVDSFPFVFNTSYGPVEADASGYVPSLNTTVPTTSLTPNPNYNICLEYSDSYANSAINYGTLACTPIPGTNINTSSCSISSKTCAQWDITGTICQVYNATESCLVTADSKVCGAMPAGCTMTGSNCVQINPLNNACILWGQNYTCSTLTNVPVTTNTCATYASNSSCVVSGSTCTSTDPYPYVYDNPAYGLLEADSSGYVSAMGTSVSLSQLSANPNFGQCYSYSNTYTCSSPIVVSGAGGFAKQVCTPIPPADLGSCTSNSTPTCISYSAGGACTNYSQNLTCTVTNAVNLCGTPPSNFTFQNSSCVETDPFNGNACVIYQQDWRGPSMFGAPAPVNNCSTLASTNGCVNTGQTCVLSDTYTMAYNSPVYGMMDATSAGFVPALSSNVPTTQLISNPNYNTCLTYSDTYTCSVPDTSNASCTPVPLSNTSNCRISSTTCMAYNAQNVCTSYSQVENCTVASPTTVPTPGTATNTTTNTCQLLPPTCTFSGTETCLDAVPPATISACNTLQKVYNCTSPSPSTNSCSSNLCIGANCYGSGDQPNQNFAAAVAALETAKQMGKFGGINLFYGESHDCTDVLGGLFSCCQVRSSPPQSGSNLQAAVTMAAQFGLQHYQYFSQAISGSSTFTENQFMSSMLGGQSDTMAVGGVMENANFYGVGSDQMSTVFGDSYSYDSLMSNQSFFNMDFSTLSNWAGTGANILAQYGVISPDLATAVSLGSSYYSSVVVAGCIPCFVVIAILTVIQYLSSCSQQEMQLSLLRGKGLCHDVGTYCSNSFLGICLETDTTFCCFDSKFSLDVNEGGRPQIGKSWGSATNPDCSGFSVNDIANINFGLINFTNAFGDIASTVNVPSAATLQSQVSNKINGYYAGQTTPATPVQQLSMQQVLAVAPGPTTTPATQITTLPIMACTATWGPQVPDAFIPADYTSSINIASCNPGATLDLNYTGNCTSTALSPGQSTGTLSVTLSASGTATIPVSMPYTCLPQPATATSPAIVGSLNTWKGVVTQGGAPGATISITW